MTDPLNDRYEIEWPDLPPSMNTSASGYRGNPHAAARVKRTWEGVCMAMLLKAKVPKHAYDRIEVTGTLVVPDRRRRDEGNFRMLLEKCLGDVLVTGGWLPDDTPEHYSFGRLQFEYEKGVRCTRLELTCS